MTIYGVALLALCTLLGAFAGDALGVALGVKANVGGVGIAMVLLVAARFWLSRRGAVPEGVTFGVGFWSKMYIPIVVAMAANQNVLAALKGGPMVAVAAIATAVACFLAVPLLAAVGRPKAEAKPEAGGAS
jgi:malonate transporter MadL subunit